MKQTSMLRGEMRAARSARLRAAGFMPAVCPQRTQVRRDKPAGSLVSFVRSSLLPLFLLLFAAPGCVSVPLFGVKNAKFDRADAKNPAVQILALWQASEGPGPNGVPTRGFAGQIFFFTQPKPNPVVVDGKVRIYLFDDRGSVKEQGRPIGEFDFDPVNWNAHAHSSTLGPGYAIFIPYPRNDFHQASCSLRIRFTPNVGPTIYSPTASVVLTGPPTKPADADQTLFPSQARQQAPQNVNPARLPMTTAPFNTTQFNTTQFNTTQFGTAPSYTTPSHTTPSGTAQLGTTQFNTTAAGGPPLPSSSRVAYAQNVVPVAGTDADARVSLEDDVAAPDAGVPSSPPPDEATSSRSHRMRLQSADAAASDPEEE